MPVGTGIKLRIQASYDNRLGIFFQTMGTVHIASNTGSLIICYCSKINPFHLFQYFDLLSKKDISFLRELSATIRSYSRFFIKFEQHRCLMIVP